MNLLMEILASILSYFTVVLTGKAAADEINQEPQHDTEHTRNSP
jgi:hypothetical protein